jgi:prepilin-type N-terminal cleavage/methylation domain-containing protein
MKINKTSTTYSLLKQRERISAFTLIELLVVIAIIAILASIALPVFSSVQERGKQTKDMANGKQIALALKQFASDHDGSFPNKKPGADYNAAVPLDATNTSNDAFWWLFPTYLTSEDIFVVPNSGWATTADNRLDAVQGTQSLVPPGTLTAGENAYAYVTALSDTANAQFPLVGDAGIPGSFTTDNHFTNVKGTKGGVWGGQKAIVIFVDGSARVMTVNNQVAPISSFPTRPGHTYSIFDGTGQGAGTTDPWLTTTNLILPPR